MNPLIICTSTLRQTDVTRDRSPTTYPLRNRNETTIEGERRPFRHSDATIRLLETLSITIFPAAMLEWMRSIPWKPFYTTNSP